MTTPADTTTTIPFEEADPGDTPAEPLPQPTTTLPIDEPAWVDRPVPERGPQSTIPGNDLGACFVYATGEAVPDGQYTTSPLERPHDGTTEIGALKCWVPQEVQAPQPEPGCVIDGVSHPMYVIDPTGPGLTGVGNIRCDIAPEHVELIVSEPGTPAVPVPTAVNTGDELAVGGAGGFFLVSASLAAVAVAALLGRRKVQS